MFAKNVKVNIAYLKWCLFTDRRPKGIKCMQIRYKSYPAKTTTSIYYTLCILKKASFFWKNTKSFVCLFVFLGVKFVNANSLNCLTYNNTSERIPVTNLTSVDTPVAPKPSANWATSSPTLDATKPTNLTSVTHVTSVLLMKQRS